MTPQDIQIDPLPGAGKLEKAYAYLRLLSLDVVGGAIGAALMVVDLTGADVEWPFFVVLGLAVWLIYTLDHLLDAQKLGASASTPRHQFHHRFFKPLLVIWTILLLACGGMALTLMGKTAILFGLGMLGMTLGHLLLVRWVGDKTSPFLIKEMGVTLVYCLGIWGLPLLVSGTWNAPSLLALLVQFVLLALVNLLEFSMFEHDLDAQDGQTSFVRAIGKKATRRLVMALLLLVFALSAVLFCYGAQAVGKVALIHALMGAGLVCLLVWPRTFVNLERYRAWGDGVFLLPYLCLL